MAESIARSDELLDAKETFLGMFEQSLE